MIVIPAIDLKEGKCVRLLQGRMEDATIYSDSPADTAKRWADMGAELIHVVDLDGAFAGSHQNMKSIEEIIKAIDVPIEVGGGIRDLAGADRMINIGVSRVIFGTAAAENPSVLVISCKKHPGKVIAGIDAHDGRVAVRGWDELSNTKVEDLARQMEDSGVRAIIYTDISRDGMLTGHNHEATKTLATHVGVPIIASGGVKDLDDIRELMKIKNLGIEGVITGKAIYEGTMDLAEAIAITKGEKD
jgi:phosphoribosylformimino-5-aminoimidazole carboxamide ribotide isomerase